MAIMGSTFLSLADTSFSKLSRSFQIVGHFIASLIPLIYLFSVSSLFFDIVHYQLHQCTRSSHPFLRRLERIHHFHHLYYNRKMKFDQRYLRQNQFQALPLELGFQIIGSCLGYMLAVLVVPNAETWITEVHLWTLLGIQILRSTFVICTSGRDSNHLTYQRAPKDPNWIFVGPEFHCLHHVYPKRYMGSFVKCFDWVWGTASSLRTKRFVLTGGSGAFGQAMVAELKREGVRCIRTLKFGSDWNHNDFEGAISAFSKSDVLILAHGSKGQSAVESNCDSSVELVRLFKQHSQAKELHSTLPEVWYVGSEIELHPSWGNAELQRYSVSKRKLLPHARSFFDDPEILYRHIVPSSFSSSMGYAIVSATWTAKVTMWWIHRGARYIPATYTGIAYFNYLKFMWWVPYAGDAQVD
ncbi:unnamed protein product [Penicillium salamii]|nr:unnamed protein product [Penicillium salamii]CAG8414951.1 unnamed protein product [Penicillium salamii]